MSLATVLLFAACVTQAWGLSYKVTIRTGGRRYAGTDADVFINIVGTKGKTGKIVLGASKTNKDPFEKGKTDVFTVDGAAVGKISKLIVGHNNARRSAAWYLDSVSVEAGGCTTLFEVSMWLYTGRLQIETEPASEKGNCDAFSYSNPIPNQAYEVLIKTGSRSYAGTDADVYVNIVGEKGQTGKVVLGASKTNSDAFERGQKDLFTIEGPPVGRIVKVIVGHNNGGRSAAWYLDSLTVQVGKCSTTFEVWKWLFTSRLEIDAFPTLERGECNKEISFSNNPTEYRSAGRNCTRDFRKIGCFPRDLKLVPDLVITDLDPTHTAFTKTMNWVDYALGLHDLACRCRAKAASQGYKYFGIGFLGECVAGKNHKGLEEMFEAAAAGHAAGCVDGKWGICDKDEEEECGGHADYDFFYEILPPLPSLNQ